LTDGRDIEIDLNTYTYSKKKDIYIRQLHPHHNCRYGFGAFPSVTMPRDESDSSDEEGSLYTTTNVTLGYASKEPTDDPFSQLGGLPVSSPQFA